MSTNYRVTTPREIFNKNSSKDNDNSLFDQVSNVLKGSLQFIWNYLKEIDMVKKGTVEASEGKGKDIVAKQSILGAKDTVSNNNKSPPLINNSNHLIKDQEAKQPFLSKRQKLKQKKQRKRISFDQFIEQQENKINGSFIKKNIQMKKALNKSLVMDQQQQRLNEVGDKLLQQGLVDNGNENNIEQKDKIYKREKQLLISNNKQPNLLHMNNINDSLVLNISDIDSECNFNILNSSQLNQSSSKNQHNRSQLFRDNLQEVIQNNVVGGELLPKLQLKEYPFLCHGMRMSYRAAQKNKPQQRRLPIINHNKTNKNKNKSKSKQQQSSTINIDNDNQQKDYIDVDALYYPPLEHNPKKRITAPFMKSNESLVRKKIKHNQHLFSSETSKITSKILEKQEKFDRLVASRYEKMIESLNGEKQDDREHPLTLKQEYEKFLLENFSAPMSVKLNLQKEASTEQKTKFSQHLKQIDLSPLIERKKLYNFTKQCESKISVRQELRKSVTQDKQRQQLQEMRRKQEEEMRRMKEQADIVKRKVEEMRQREQELRKIKQKQEEQMRIAQQLQKQQNQKGEGQKQNQSETKKISQISQNQQILKPAFEKVPSNEGVASTNLEQLKQKAQKPFSLFDVPKTSLFSLAQKKPSQQKIPEQQAIKVSPKSPQVSKSGSIVEGKSSDEIKPKQTAEVKGSVELVSKPSESEQQKKAEPAKHNPFLAQVKTPSITLLQQLINTKKDDTSLFKSTISSTPLTANSPQRQPQSQNPNVFLSPAHNTSQYSNLDSSMCEQSESNITPGNSQVLQNNILPGNNLNGSFLNASFSSHTNSVFPGNSQSLFNGPTSSGIVGQTSGLFGNQPSQAPSGGLFGNQQSGMFLTPGQSAQAKYDAVHKIPSFMQNQTSVLTMISPQTAANMFSQRSPSKNEPQSLFAPTPLASKPAPTRRDKRKQQRIR